MTVQGQWIKGSSGRVVVSQMQMPAWQSSPTKAPRTRAYE